MKRRLLWLLWIAGFVLLAIYAALMLSFVKNRICAGEGFGCSSIISH